MKKYIRYLPVLILLLFSIKPALFTWNLLFANYHLHRPGDETAAKAKVVHSLQYNPSSYTVFKSHFPELTDHVAVITAIYANDIHTLEDLGLSKIDISRIQTQYKDNFYFQSIHSGQKGRINESECDGRNWQNLDAVSLEILADQKMNPRSIEIFKQIPSTFEPSFTHALADYCRWKGNHELATYLFQNHHLQNPAFLQGNIKAEASIQYVQQFLSEKYHLKDLSLEENRLQYSDFEGERRQVHFRENWFFSNMTNIPPFAKGSFTIGLDGNDENHMLRMMGFLVTV